MTGRRLKIIEWRPAPGPASRAVFAAKLQVPDITDCAVPRPRLHKLLDTGVKRGSVVVDGPAGSGKTHLAAAWAREPKSTFDIAWLTLGEHERDPARFLKYVVQAVHATEAGRQATEALAALPAVAAVNSAYLLALSAALGELPRPVALVLDDFEAVVGSETERLAGRILRYPQGRLHVVVLSRVVPSIGQARLHLEDRLVEVGAEELAFTHAEALELYRRQVPGLGEEQVRALVDRTRGWSAGLRLLGDAVSDASAVDADLEAGDVDDAALDYLLSEVFEKQPTELQHFLLRAATHDLVCDDLVTELTGGGEKWTLAELRRRNLFVERVGARVGDRRTWYRWHPMFADVLRARLHLTDPALAAELHRTASRWLLHDDFLADAVRHSMQAHDVDAAAAMLGDGWLDLAVAGETEELRDLLMLFDEQRRVVEPELMAACAAIRLQSCDLERSCRCAGEAAAHLDVLSEEGRLDVESVATVVRLHRAAMLGEPAEEYPEGVELLHRLSREDRFLTDSARGRRVLVLYHLGAYEASREMWDQAGEHLAEALDEATTLGITRLVPRSRAHLAWFHLVAGRLGEALTAASDVVGSVRANGRPDPHALAPALAVLGAVEILRGEPDIAMAYLEEADHVVHAEDRPMRLRVGLVLHACLLASGQVAAARAELVRVGRELRAAATDDGAATLAVAEAAQLVAEHRPDEALARVSAFGPAPSSTTGDEGRVVRARALVAAGRPDQARRQLRRVTVVDDDRPVRVAALVLDAVAAQQEGWHEEALEALTRALEKAGPERIVLPFLTEGGTVQPLLEELLDRGTAYEDLSLEILARLAPPEQGGHSSHFYVEPLTAREVEVLRALQGTASNEEIAERLFVSLNTLRTHVKHIHRKLGTTSRREAVARARELALL